MAYPLLIQAWGEEDTYASWVQRFGPPEAAAAKLVRDPTARLAPLHQHLPQPLQGARVCNLLASHGTKAVAMALLGAQVSGRCGWRQCTNLANAPEVAAAASWEQGSCFTASRPSPPPLPPLLYINCLAGHSSGHQRQQCAVCVRAGGGGWGCGALRGGGRAAAAAARAGRCEGRQQPSERTMHMPPAARQSENTRHSQVETFK